MLRPHEVLHTYQQTANGVTTQLTQDLVSPLSQVLQTTAGAATVNYVYGTERLLKLNGLVRTWSQGDALGSVRQTLDDAGTALTQLHYDPWGTPEGAAPEGFGFTGEWQDAASGLVHLRARWYSPGAGTFTARDPFAGFRHDGAVEVASEEGKGGAWSVRLPVVAQGEPDGGPREAAPAIHRQQPEAR